MKKILLFLFVLLLLSGIGNAQCVVQQQNSGNVTCIGSCDGFAEFVIGGGSPPYNLVLTPGGFSSGPFTSFVRVDSLCSGTYNWTVSDQTGCLLTGNISITEPPPIIVSANVIHPSCSSCQDGLISIFVNGGTPPYAFNWSNGSTGQTLGNLSDGIYVVNIVDANGCWAVDSIVLGFGFNQGYRIKGKVFLDIDSNGVQTVGEPDISGQIVNLQPNNWNAYTNQNGEYMFIVPDGNYTVEYAPIAGWSITSTPAIHALTINGADTMDIDFGIKPNLTSPDVQGLLSSGIQRCGFQVLHWITYKNTGTSPSAAVKLEMLIDPLITYFSASITPDTIQGNRLVWMRPGLWPQEQNSIHLLLNMPLTPGVSVQSTLTTSLLDSTGNELASDMDTLNGMISCSYDPNDKAVVPAGIGSQHLTPMNQLLDYMIRFQNTGNDTAFTVVLRDTLDAALDRSTFEVSASSHPVNTTMDANGVLTFRFENILLPDSIVDEPGSHGFVRYRIYPQSGIADPTVINNTAYIYFDFNAAIITNTTMNTLSDILLSTPNPTPASGHLFIYPNPATNKITVELRNVATTVLLQVYNNEGRLVRSQYADAGQKTQLGVQDLSPGIYVIKSLDLQSGGQHQSRMIINR